MKEAQTETPRPTRRTIRLSWTAPVPLREVHAGPGAERPGVYLWTVRVRGEWWLYYAGETGRSFAERHIGHIACFYSGQYRIYEPGPFSEGRQILVWGGGYGPRNWHKLPEYWRRAQEFLPVLDGLLSLIHVFRIPLNESRRTRERLEAALAMRVRTTSTNLQEDDVRFHPCQPGEEGLRFLMPALPIAGLRLEEITLP